MILSIKGYTFLIDDEDYEKVMKYTWQINKQQEKLGRIYLQTRLPSKEGRKHISFHRYIMGCINGDGKIVDHRDGNTLDCRKSNLRFCTKLENARNCKRNSKNTSGYKGVSYRKDIKKWIAGVYIKKHRIHLGYFPTPELARDAYVEASKKYYGDFRRTE